MAGGEHLAQRLDGELSDVAVSTHSQGAAAMCQASVRLSEAIGSGRLHHPDDPALTAHMLAAGVRQVGESWRFAKQPGKSSRIDACIALAMAYSVMVETTVGSVYDQRGLLVI